MTQIPLGVFAISRRHEMTGVGGPCIGIDFTIPPVGPDGEIVWVEEEAFDIDASPRVFFELEVRSVPPFLKRFRDIRPTELTKSRILFLPKPQQTDAGFIHGRVLSVSGSHLLTRTEGAGESISCPGGAA